MDFTKLNLIAHIIFAACDKMFCTVSSHDQFLGVWECVLSVEAALWEMVECNVTEVIDLTPVRLCMLQ